MPANISNGRVRLSISIDIALSETIFLWDWKKSLTIIGLEPISLGCVVRMKRPEPPETATNEVVAIDIGGTHARFSVATIGDGKVVSLGPVSTLRTIEHVSFEAAWVEFAHRIGRRPPRAAAIAVAGPVREDVIKFTNNQWVIHPASINLSLDVDRHILINDFGAIAHAVAQAGPEYFEHLSGPDAALPKSGTITIIGPGTGLGVAHLWRGETGYRVQETEGGHVEFAPIDALEDAILASLRPRYGRVSVERVVSGPGLVAIYEALAALEGRSVQRQDDKSLWDLGTSGTDGLAAKAIGRFCMSLGSVAGDIALSQGGAGVVIAGGLGLRIKDSLSQSRFAERFCAKGRFATMMSEIPVKLISHPQPGLLGAAAAFAKHQRDGEVADLPTSWRP